MVSPQQTSRTASSSFSACDEIASFYETLNIPARKSTGIFGGKSFTWYVTDQGQSFQVFCKCSMGTLGYGRIRIQSRMASENPSERFFRKSSTVDPKTATVTLEGILFVDRHEIRLPTTDKNMNQNVGVTTS